MVEYPTRNWFAVLLGWRGTVVPRILGRTLLVALVAAAVVYARRARGLDVEIPLSIHSIVGVALGLLLVFRTNASYDRYWEGRKLLGSMVNACRDIARQLASYLPPGEPRARAAGYIVALYGTIRRSLRGEREWGELAEHLADEELRGLARVDAPPLYVATRLSALLAERCAAGELHELRLQRVDENLTRMIDLWGGAERIVKTPLPFAYAHHIKLFLALFCFTVPLALHRGSALFTVLGSAVVAFALFGIEEIGVEIEDPFGYDPNDLPLDAIGATIERDVLGALGEDPGPGSA